jgi:nicotinamide mononucleotide adenylyltransferase
LEGVGIQYSIAAIPDHESDFVWYQSITDQHDFDAIMTGNDWPAAIFADNGHRVHRPRFDWSINATSIRELLEGADRQQTQQHLSPSVYLYLQKIQADVLLAAHS